MKASKESLAELDASVLDEIVPDLVMTGDMSTPLILHILKERLKRREIYVSRGIKKS
jgi:hypothetical protein